MCQLLIELPAERDRCGRITLVGARGRSICGPFAVAARASDALAALRGNPRRDPLFRYGDTPTGSYVVRQLIKSGAGTKFAAMRVGHCGVILLEPVSGQAARAEANGRFHLLIIGGELSKSGQLRSTAGSLRVSNKDQRALFRSLKGRKDLRCEIATREGLPDFGTVFVDQGCKDADPQSLPRAEISTRRLVSEKAVRQAAAPAVVLGLAVSFIAASGLEEAHASVDASGVHIRPVDIEVASRMPTFPHQGARLAGRQGDYVKLAYGQSSCGADCEDQYKDCLTTAFSVTEVTTCTIMLHLCLRHCH